MANFDKHLMVEKEWELKLKEELVTFKILKRPLFRVGGPSTGKGRSTHLEKEEVLTREQAHSIKMESWLTQIENLLCQANDKIKAIKEQAMPAAIQAIEEYKMLVDLKQDATDTKADKYLIGFTDYMSKVAQAYLELDLGNILADEAVLEEEEEEGVAKEQDARIEEPVATLKQALWMFSFYFLYFAFFFFRLPIQFL